MSAYSIFTKQLMLIEGVGSKAPGFDAMGPTMILSSIFYGGLGLGVAGLGIGSILAKRWAWRLAISLGWLWVLLIGLSAVSFIFLIPQVMGQFGALSSGASGPGGSSSSPMGGRFEILMMGVAFTTALLIYLVPGAILIVIYGMRSARVTCEHCDPKPRWTDAVPIPVLVLWLLFVVTAFGLLAFAPIYWGMVQIPGMPLPPALATVAWAVFLPLLVFTARELGAMRLRGWWISLFLTIVGSVGSVLWLSNYDIMQVYRDMNLPEEQLKNMEAVMGSGLDLWLPAAAGGSLMTGYVFWLKRFFRTA
jgi:hypothetical protein